jgi:hypothetical protein
MGYVEGIMSWPLLLMATIRRNAGERLGVLGLTIILYLDCWQEEELIGPIRLSIAETFSMEQWSPSVRDVELLDEFEYPLFCFILDWNSALCFFWFL